jgi:hypothetical protein
MSEMTCPFCNEQGFDAIGLKLHLQSGWCEAFNAVPYPRSMATEKKSTTPETDQDFSTKGALPMEAMARMDQPAITGYRKLTDEEGQLMNEVKALGKSIEGHIAMIESHLRTQEHDAVLAGAEERLRIDMAQPKRWVAIAKTDFQTALMALTRAIAQPGSF